MSLAKGQVVLTELTTTKGKKSALTVSLVVKSAGVNTNARSVLTLTCSLTGTETASANLGKIVMVPARRPSIVVLANTTTQGTEVAKTVVRIAQSAKTDTNATPAIAVSICFMAGATV